MDAIKHGTLERGFSIYFLPIQSELGISRAAYSLADLMGRLAGGLQAPAIGYLIARLGSRTMMVAGATTLGLGFILMYFTNSYLFFLLVFVGLLSTGARAGFNNAAIPALNYWFRRKRSLVISIVHTGPGLGGALITPLVGLMVFNLGWRTSALVSGIIILAVVVPLCLLVRRSPESMGLLPDGVHAQAPRPLPGEAQHQADQVGPEVSGSGTVTPAAGPPYADVDFSTKEAMLTPTYWFLVFAMGLRNSVHAGIQWHLVPLMVWSGVSATTAALFVGVMSLNSIVFNPCAGWMGDHWSKQRIIAAGMVTGGLAMVALMLGSGHLWELTIFVMLLALTDAVTPLNWAILADSFGRTSYPTLYGWLQTPNQLMSMGTPVFVGWIFDRTDSYFWALVPFAIVYVLAAALYWNLPRPETPLRLQGL